MSACSRFWTTLILAFGLVCIPPRAQATELVLEQTRLVSGSFSETFAFTAPSSGIVSVELQNLGWPTPLGSLNFLANTPTEVLDTWSVTDGPSAPQSFTVGPGAYFAQITGQAAGPLDLGLFSVSVSFTPSSTPVPLPASLWLLLTGLGVLCAQKRKRHV